MNAEQLKAVSRREDLISYKETIREATDVLRKYKFYYEEDGDKLILQLVEQANEIDLEIEELRGEIWPVITEKSDS